MRYGHSASAMGDLVYIFGGRNDTHGACNILYCFDTSEMSYLLLLLCKYHRFYSMLWDTQIFNI